MKLLSLFLLTFTISTGVEALSVSTKVKRSDQIDWSVHQWQAPGPNDARSPCPGLNTLANHGFLPRNGSNITIPVVLQAINEGFNFEPIGITVATSKVALLTTDAEDSFSLSDLALHGTLEHDVSVSRNDFALGDNLHFNATVFATLNDSNPGFDFYNATSAARVLEQRLEEDKIVNPNLINTAKEFSIREIEAAFYLSTMGNVTSGVAPKKFVQVLFTEERLPLEEGWTPSEILIGEENFGNLLALIDNQTTWAASGEVICPWIRLQPEGGVTIVEG